MEKHLKGVYRDCEYAIHRQVSLGGWIQSYYTAYKDTYLITEDFTESVDINDAVLFVKTDIDEFLDDFKGNEELHGYRFEAENY